ncbi:unnamed protein product [Closterium sp. Naga37s-1]|nr:unnamed protein product [Closterium sp. Naga37s-1]
MRSGLVRNGLVRWGTGWPVKEHGQQCVAKARAAAAAALAAPGARAAARAAVWRVQLLLRAWGAATRVCAVARACGCACCIRVCEAGQGAARDEKGLGEARVCAGAAARAYA